MTTIGVISDTHVNRGSKRVLAPIIFDLFKSVDLILHAGDLNTLDVVHDLESLAPVFAVLGNNCDFEAIHSLPRTREIGVEDAKIGLVHGDRGRGGDTTSIAFNTFPDADCIVFGHSHWPYLKWKTRYDGGQVLLFNPGSAGQKRRAQHFSCGILRVDGKHIEAELRTWD